MAQIGSVVMIDALTPITVVNKREETLKKFNNSTKFELNRQLKLSPGGDIGPLLTEMAEKYKRKRKAKVAEAEKNQRDYELGLPPPGPSSPPSRKANLRLWASETTTIHPIHASVLDLLASAPEGRFVPDNHSPDLPTFESLVALDTSQPGSPLLDSLARHLPPCTVVDQSNGGVAVVLSKDVLILIRSRNHPSEDPWKASTAQTMELINKSAPAFPMSAPLGVLRLGRFFLIFQTYLCGHRLDKIWEELTKHQKSRLKKQLSDAFKELRSVAAPPGTSYGNAGGLCVDTRFTRRQSKTTISNEEDWLDFYVGTSHKHTSDSYLRFLRHLVTKGSRLVLTHGDLLPRNIIVDSKSEASPLVGIIDFETSGWYPEYWEYVKGLHTEAAGGEWWEIVAVGGIGEYAKEFAVDTMVHGLQQWKT